MAFPCSVTSRHSGDPGVAMKKPRNGRTAATNYCTMLSFALGHQGVSVWVLVICMPKPERFTHHVFILDRVE